MGQKVSTRTLPLLCLPPWPFLSEVQALLFCHLPLHHQLSSPHYLSSFPFLWISFFYSLETQKRSIKHLYSITDFMVPSTTETNINDGLSYP